MAGSRRLVGDGLSEVSTMRLVKRPFEKGATVYAMHAQHDRTQIEYALEGVRLKYEANVNAMDSARIPQMDWRSACPLRRIWKLCQRFMPTDHAQSRLVQRVKAERAASRCASL